MFVYRIGNSIHAEDLSGEGARKFGGRWNHVGVSCIYTAGTRALALLEFCVNVDISSILQPLSVTTIEIDPGWIKNIEMKELPRNWRELPSPVTTKDFASKLFKAAAYPAYRLPSTIMPEEYNYIINPLHPDSKKVKIIEVRRFIFDMRIKAGKK